ncbi:MAG: hypothetical protein WCE75_06565 [Terracidiphilus sp.]
MRKRTWILPLLLAASSVNLPAQKPTLPRTSAAELELTTEVAARTEKGYPAVLRVTLRNAAGTVVNFPLPATPCVPFGGGVSVTYGWRPRDEKDHSGLDSGWGCGRSDPVSLMERVRAEWIRLEAGESVTLSWSFEHELDKRKPGKVTYWATYTPPEATDEEWAELEREGYNVPAKTVRSREESFVVE